MSKYTKGDKFEIEIEQVMEPSTTGRNALYRIKGFSALTFDDYGLSLLKQIKTEEPEVDWSMVAVDTPILVSADGLDWRRRYFAKYEAGLVRAWDCGATSWSGDDNTAWWKYAKLVK